MASTCKTCGAPILWARTVHGKAIPLDPEPHLDGTLAVIDGLVHYVHKSFGMTAARYRSHFATCPQAKTHRKE